DGHRQRDGHSANHQGAGRLEIIHFLSFKRYLSCDGNLLMPEITLTIKSKVGLHARPAALFVREAARFKSAITVQNGDKQANAKSILNILALEANSGSVIRVRAEGED